MENGLRNIIRIHTHVKYFVVYCKNLKWGFNLVANENTFLINVDNM
jgi:hypothetical protein